jgi:hypothetical protein
MSAGSFVMIAAVELQQRILAEVQEVGFDEIHGALNTVLDPTGSLDEVDRLREALVAITQKGFGYLCLERINPRELVRLNDDQAADLLAKLGDWFRFDTADHYWTLGNGDPLKDYSPVLFLTKSGIDEAHRILEVRGSNWWISRRP